MAIVRMQKMAVLAHKEASEAIITRLQEEGILEVIAQPSGKPVDHIESDFHAAEIDFAIAVLTEIAPKDVLKKLQEETLPGEIIAAAHATDTKSMIARLHDLHTEDSALERELSEIRNQILTLKPWSEFNETLPPEIGTASCERMFGTLPDGKMQEFKSALMASLPLTSLDVFGSELGLSSISAFVWRSERMKFEEVATIHGWTSVRAPEMTGLPSTLLEGLSMRESTLQEALEANAGERMTMAKSLPDLVKVRQYVRWLSDRAIVREQMMMTETTALITGWMPESDISRIEKSLSSVTPSVALLKIEPDEGEEAPILLHNPLLISPFESVTTLYGLPLPSEMDPTMALAPFFALFFALCITDAGYGFAIAMIMGLYLFVTKKSIRKAPLWWAVCFGGIAAFFVGIPFGGWFGLDPNKLPEALHFLRTPVGDGYWFKLQVWNLGTQEGIQFLQNLALILGIIHLFFGMFLAGWHKWIHGKKASAFWEHFTAHILLVGVLARVFASDPYIPTATYALYGAGILLIWGKGYGSPWYLRPVMGLLGAINFAISLLSNGLSYLRLLALGLVTGAIALAVDQVATEIGKLFPLWIGIPVVILVAVTGHTVSIALNTLGSFIHAGRLQFIEFFSQFFEGGGRPFTPFSRSTNS